ncbi:hypothetical protein GCM10027089_43380 [Nocardia thraciensis]
MAMHLEHTRSNRSAFRAPWPGYLGNVRRGVRAGRGSRDKQEERCRTTTLGTETPSCRPKSDPGPRVFDRFATVVAGRVSQAWFFTVCALIVVLWAPTIWLTDLDTWQLIINTVTTVITFLLVALLQNTQRRSDAAVQQKLNALADGLADLMEAAAADNPRLVQDRRELLEAVGLEQREGAG